MSEMVLPGVYIEERAEALIVPSQITVGNLGIVGTASKGPIGLPIIIGSRSEAREIFGGYDTFIDGNQNELTLVRALDLAYANGASTAFVVRVTNTEDKEAGPNFIKEWDRNTTARQATFSIAGETDGSIAAKLRAKTHGTWGNKLTVNVWDADGVSFIDGEEYSGGSTISLKRVPAENARNRVIITIAATGQARVLSIVYINEELSSGKVFLDIANQQLKFYDNEDPGNKDSVKISYTVPKDQSRKVTIRYGGTSETYTVADGNHLKDLINNATSPSRLVEAFTDGSSVIGSDIPKKHKNFDDFREFGKAADTPGSDGANAVASDYELGLEQLLNEDAHIIVAAGMDHNAIGSKLKEHCERASTDKMKKDRIAVAGSEVNASVDTIRSHEISSERVIFVAPGIKSTDITTGKEVTLPGSYAAAVIAGMLCGRSPHISLTNKTLSVSGLEVKFTQAQLETLLNERVLALEERNGFRIVKGITTDKGPYRQITTRRIVDYAKYGVRSAAESYIGLLNNDRVRKALKGTINGFLVGMIDDEMLISYELDVNATRDEEIRGIARVTMTLRPTFSIDFIKVVMFLG